jgi:predicted XRE-type DNA-binding protein
MSDWPPFGVEARLDASRGGQPLRVTQQRINHLLRGRVSRFSIDALVNMATALGCRVRFDLEAARLCRA